MNYYSFTFDVQYNTQRDRQKGGVSTEDGVPLQVASLARTVLAFAKNVDNLDAILPNVHRIAHKHVSRGIESSQYEAIGDSLLFAIKEVLSDAATDAIMTAWTEAFGFLADTFISIEADLKKKLAESAGFEGMVDMRVASKNDEERLIGFVPVEHGLPPYAKGQFVAVVVDELMTSVPLTEGDPTEVTVKRRDNKEKATLALARLKEGDVIKVSMPCGKAL